MPLPPSCNERERFLLIVCADQEVDRPVALTEHGMYEA